MQTSSSEYSLRSKWNQLVNKRTTDNSTHYKDYRRPSHCSDQSVSSSASTGTLDKLLLGLPSLFKRRCSSASTQSDSSASPDPLYEEDEREYERLDELYQTAVDEISYAEDSRGSRYYPGDVASAREAMDTCAEAFVQLLHQAPDRQTHDQLHATIVPKLLTLQSRFDALPSPNTD
ncbi:hypothetical protein BC941DRAFT_467713 [Chlamydoabsidia padenii]|nr:hypothetical protein BC941DRAFT_467713 [Chlamydoabsidia padenii]